jgi:glycosyltransferase involved in cell wall biosynthesis
MKKNKNILVIAERFYPEEFGINDLVQAWQQKGYKVAVLTQAPSYPFGKIYEGYKNKLFQAEKWKGIRIYRIFSLMGYKENVLLKILNYLCFVFLLSFAVLFLGKRYGKIFVYQTGPLTQAIPAVFAGKIFRKSIYMWTLDLWPDTVYAYGFKKTKFLSKFLDLLVTVIYKNCQKIFVSCKGFGDKIKNYASGADIFFAPQWPPDDFSFVKNDLSISLKEGFHFTFAGNIGKVQNLENVIEGFSLVNQSRGKLQLNIIGDGSNLENLKEKVNNKNINDVFFWGRQPLKDMPGWFKASDVLIISLIDKPIFSLTVPAKFQAYLVSGKPIYCIMNGEARDLVVENNIGFAADPNNIAEIKEGFEKFLKIPKQNLQSFKRNAGILLRDKFDKTKVIEHMTEEIFNSN